ncbi:major facilitator superfamily domain-containing protein [Lactarius akahatsu]|uniref:Major facilitator superfamily domain-containing protein n=1 Tax=Lactarius akahatsu TaxID=416441 RepID=A0AAD4LRS8_9AGAM|nr:major facilitator superfamily domain-containing protein [Lactarius akahatsu]
MTTPSDLSPSAILYEKTHSVTQSTKNPAVWNGKAEVDRRSPSPSPAPPASTRSTFASICIVAACTSAQLTSIGLGPAYAISVPYAGKDLHIQKENLQWILNAYSISSACFLLLCGRLADLYGRKRVWLVGYSIFVVFGIGSGFAQSEKVLDTLRGMQGIGSAAIIPASLGILAKAFPPGPSRSIAFTAFSAGAPIGAIFAIVLGGVLTQVTKATWRTPIFLLSGVALAFTILGFFVFEEDEPSTEEDTRVDWIGAALITAGLVLIVFVLSDSPTARRGWKSPHVIALFVIGVLLVLLFVAWQYYLERRLENPDLPRTRWTAPPLMKPSMWTRAHGRFAVMQTIACVNWAAFTIWIVWVELYYQTYLNLSPIHTMLRLLPMFASGTVANILIVLMIGRVDVMYIVATGTLLTGCADVLFAVIDPNAPYWAFGFPAACLIVLGVDFTFASGTLFIAKVSLPHEQSVAGALFQAMTQLGSAIGVSVSTIVFNSVLRTQSRRLGVVADAQGDNVPLPAQLKAYKAAMWTGFTFGLLCTILCVIFLRGVGVVGETPGQDSPAHRNSEDGGPVNANGKLKAGNHSLS